MNIEQQKDPQIHPGPGWIEVDHASAAVSFDPEIAPQILEFFELQIDPTDKYNKWLSPMPGVEVIETIYGDYQDVFRILLPDGREAAILYHYDSDQPSWNATIEFSPQPALFGTDGSPSY